VVISALESILTLLGNQYSFMFISGQYTAAKSLNFIQKPEESGETNSRRS